MDKLLHIAIIGCGQWGRHYVRIFSQTPGVKIKYVCDSDPKAIEAIKPVFTGISYIIYISNAEVIFSDSDVQAVIIATPVSTHYTLAMAALNTGKHVLCEKPLAADVSEVQDLIVLAQSKKLVLLPGHIFIYNEAIQFVKRQLDSKALGSVYYITGQRTGLGPIRNDVNALYDLATHDISILIYLLGEMPVQVQATGERYLRNEHEDMVVLQMLFPSKVLATITVSWLHPKKVRELCIVGSDKMLVFDDIHIDEKIKIFDKGVTYQPDSGDFGQFQLALRDGDIYVPNIKYPEPLKLEIDDFISAINNTTQTVVPPYQALQVAMVLEAAAKSLKTNSEWVEVGIKDKPGLLKN